MGKNIIRARTNEVRETLSVQTYNILSSSHRIRKHKKTAGYIPAEKVPGGSVYVLYFVTV